MLFTALEVNYLIWPSAALRSLGEFGLDALSRGEKSQYCDCARVWLLELEMNI